MDTRNNLSNRRHYAVLNKNKKPVLIVQANVYFPDCFDWYKLYQRNWTVHVVERSKVDEFKKTNNDLSREGPG